MGIFSYTPQRPGRGVKKGAPELRRPFLFVAKFFENFWNFIKMNILFIIACIPVVTIGPAICALTYFSKCVTEETHMFLLSEFLEKMKKNFFKGLFAFIINLVPLFSLGVIWTNLALVPHFSMLLLPLLLINMVIIMMSFYIYPMIISYDLPLWAIYKNAFIFTMIKLPFNLLVLVLFIGSAALIVFFQIVVGNLLSELIGYGLSLLITSIVAFCAIGSFLNFIPTFALLPTIKKYMEE